MNSGHEESALGQKWEGKKTMRVVSACVIDAVTQRGAVGLPHPEAML